ncbi:IDEAL domain-containing protein [Paenibacillus sp. ISL-20]|uniref:IDEAL domain-containing protein n=1 Tax=Paenibacillus sp. ISL-20 TaxID=2819163 RepID=UPI001BE703D3|nr:IDEAL domain-containing protein [Paenibacillus sp. ISL-20]MBT2760005.1 IDEAL domain-containing protein [Paenibacillus sp. ISL-20]
MPILGKTETIELLTKQIVKEFRRKPQNLNLYVDWDFIEYDKKKREYYFDTVKRDWKSIVKFQDGYSKKFLTVDVVKNLILNEYPDAKTIHIDIRVKDDLNLLKTKTIDEIVSLMDFNVVVNLDNEILLSREEIMRMIDLALDMGNEQLFMEYSAQYKAYQI